MNKHDDRAFDDAFKHAQMMQEQRGKLPKGDAKTSNDDYQLYIIDDHQSPQDARLALDAMRADEDKHSLNLLFIRIGLTAIAIWIVVCAIVNMFWGFA